MTTTTKGERFINKACKVIDTGSACVGCMSWETPYILLETGEGRKIKWHSDSASDAMYELSAGDYVGVWGFVYGDNIRRVTVCKVLNNDGETKCFGMTRTEKI